MKYWHGLALVVAIVVAFNVRTLDGASSKKRQKSTPARVVTQGNVIVDGYGETVEKARERALDRARERVEELLETRLQGTGWAPSAEQLEPRYLIEHGVLVEEGEPKVANVPDEKPFVAQYRVTLTSQYLREIESAARLQSIEARHKTLAGALGGILAVVLVTAAYLRLEESTKGYATKLLRLVAVLILAFVAATLLYLVR